MLEHEFTSGECCVAHRDAAGNSLPQCLKCKRCGWVPHDKLSSSCVPKTNSNESIAVVRKRTSPPTPSPEDLQSSEQAVFSSLLRELSLGDL